jgi:arginine decarboxylase-like protein
MEERNVDLTHPSICVDITCDSAGDVTRVIASDIARDISTKRGLGRLRRA